MSDTPTTSERRAPGLRSAYKVFRTIPTRWSDNDIYGHMNNVVHYSLFDTAVNGLLIENGVLDIVNGSEVFLVVETGCRYFAELAFPDVISAGIRVARLGGSSVRYEVGLFRDDDHQAAAEGFFIHVNVDRVTHKPVAIGGAARNLLATLLV